MACDCKGVIKGLAHIGIRVKDTEVSKKFYTELLGFELSSEQQLGASHLTFLRAGSCELELICGAKYEERTAGQIDHVAVEVKGIEAFVEKLKAAGVNMLGEIATCPTLLDGVKNVFFTGPDGERIEFFEYYNR